MKIIITVFVWYFIARVFMWLGHKYYNDKDVF